MVNCRSLKAKLNHLRELQALFNQAFEEAIRSGNLEEARALRKQIEQEIKELRSEMITPLERELHLKEQYESQLRILENTSVIETLSTGEKGITGIDNKEYPIPSYQEIRTRIRESKEHEEFLETKADQGFKKLLLVPFGMSLDTLIEKYKQVILKHKQEGKLLATKENPSDPDEQLELDTNEPVWVWDKYNQADKEGKLVYYPKQFTETNHGGKTKEQILQNARDNKGGWNILLVEDLPNIPRQGKGKTIGDKAPRKQIEAGLTSEDYLKLLQENPQYKGEQGQTPEDRIIYAITHLHETNQVIDDYQGKGSVSYEVGAWFPVFRRVPGSCWARANRQAYLGRDVSDYRNRSFGASFVARIN